MSIKLPVEGTPATCALLPLRSPGASQGDGTYTADAVGGAPVPCQHIRQRLWRGFVPGVWHLHLKRLRGLKTWLGMRVEGWLRGQGVDHDSTLNCDMRGLSPKQAACMQSA